MPANGCSAWPGSSAARSCGASRPRPIRARGPTRRRSQESEAGDTQPQYEDAEDLESDLKALYAIRDAALLHGAKVDPGNAGK